MFIEGNIVPAFGTFRENAHRRCRGDKEIVEPDGLAIFVMCPLERDALDLRNFAAVAHPLDLLL